MRQPARLFRCLGKRLARSHRLLAQVLPQIAGGAAGDTIHRARVATRRARVALKLCRPLLGRKAAAALGDDLGWLAAQMGAVRSCEVFRAAFPKAPSAFVRRLERDEAAAWSQVKAALAEPRTGRTLSALADAARICLKEREGPSARAGLARHVRKRLKRVLSAMAQIKPGSDPERLHDLRKQMKALRYLIELMDDEITAQPWLIASLAEVRQLQDWLGQFQDTSSWIEHIDGWMACEPDQPWDTGPHLQQLSAQLMATRKAMARRFSAERRRFTSALATYDCLGALKAIARDAP